MSKHIMYCVLFATFSLLCSFGAFADMLAQHSGEFGIVTYDTKNDAGPIVEPEPVLTALAEQCGAFGIVTYDLPATPKYQIAFDANGGACDEISREIEEGEAVGELPVPVRNGYKFLGWFTAADGGEEATSEMIPKEVLTLYAHWKLPEWNVTFDANGGDGGTTVQVEKGASLGELPVPTRLGYVFTGWYTAKAKGRKITAATRPAKDTTYYAYWTPGAYKVTAYKDGSGSVTGAKTYQYGQKVTLKATASKGWVFVGWYFYYDGEDAGKFWPDHAEKMRQTSISFAMPAGELDVMAVFEKASEDANIALALESADDWHLANDPDREVVAIVDSLSYAAASLTLPAGLKNGMSFVKVAGTDNQWKLVAQNPSKCAPGVYNLKITAKNRAGKSAAKSLRVFAPNSVVATDTMGVLSLGVLSQATDEPYVLRVGELFDWKALEIAPVSGWALSGVTGLPAGLKWDSKKRIVTGVATAKGCYTVTFFVSKKKTTYKATANILVEEMPEGIAGTYKGWTQTEDGAFGTDSRLVTVTIGSTGKVSAKIGSLSFAAAGYSYDEEDGCVSIAIERMRTEGKDKKAVTYSDGLYLQVLDGGLLNGEITTFKGDEMVNDDVVVFARRDSGAISKSLAKAMTVNLEAIEAGEEESHAYDLAATGVSSVMVMVKPNGTATLFGRVGGRSLYASGWLSWDANGIGTLRFLTTGMAIAIEYKPDEEAEGVFDTYGWVWKK